jgi:hypothetical protein
MTRVLFGLLLLSGCASLSLSDAIRRDATEECKNISTLNGQQMVCQWSHIYMDCVTNNWDAKICGQVDRR